MTALILPFSGWRYRRWWQHGFVDKVPKAIDIAMQHMLWVRDRGFTPRQAGATIGVVTTTWSEVVRALAEAWEGLPEDVRRECEAGDDRK